MTNYPIGPKKAAEFFGLRVLGACCPDLCRDRISKDALQKRAVVINRLINQHYDSYEKIRQTVEDGS